MKRSISVLLLVCICITLSGSAAAANWYDKPVEALKARNLLPSELFADYGKNIRRDEFCAVVMSLYRYAADTAKSVAPETAAFTDIGGSGYADEIRGAFTAKIVSGLSTTEFSPAAPITREQLSVMVYNFYTALEGAPKSPAPDRTYADGGAISGWAKSAVMFCGLRGIMTGVSADRFDPKGTVTRAQALMVAYNIIEGIKHKLPSRGEVLATFPGGEVLEGEYYAVITELMLSYDDLNDGIDWDAALVDGRMPAEYFRQEALNQCVISLALKNEAVKAGRPVTEEQKSALRTQIESMIADMGGRERYIAVLDSYMLSEASYIYISELRLYEQNYYDYLYGENGAELPAKGSYEKTDMPPYSLVKHVLIKTVDDDFNPLSAAAAAEKKKLAEQVLAKAKAGENFDALIREYGEDPGMESNPGGYYVTNDGQMVPEFETAALALKEGGISGIVETSYGYHILKRYPISAEKMAQLKKDYAENDRNNYLDTLFREKTDKLLKDIAVTKTALYGTVDPEQIFQSCMQKQAEL